MEANQVVHLLLLPPPIIRRLNLSLIFQLGKNKDKKLLPCSSSIGRDIHKKKLHKSGTKIFGNLKTRFKNLYNNNTLRLSQNQAGKSVIICRVIMPHRFHMI